MITPSYGLTATERVLPKLALDFTTAILDPRITFTRAGNTATVVDSLGVINLVNADIPRFDHDPATLICKGLLIEESRTNLVVNSSLAGTGGINPTSWLRFQGTDGAQAVSTLAASGTSNAWTFTASANRQAIYQVISVAANTTYYATVYVEQTSVIQAPGNVFSLSNFPAGATATYEVSTTTAGSRMRIRLDVGATAGTVQFRIGLGVGSNVTGTITLSCPQLEAGAFATSYIPTTSAALTRNADVATMTGTNFSDWYNNTAGSLEATFTPVLGNFGANRYPVAISNGTSAESFAIRMSSGAFIGYCLTGGVNQYFNNAGTAANNTQATCCMSLGTSGGIFAANATLGVAGGAATMPTVNRLALGEFTGVAQGAYTFQKIMYYPQRLTNSETRAFSKG